MRTQKQLLNILLSTLKAGNPEPLPYGLCWLMDNLALNEVITWPEYYDLRETVNKHKPLDAGWLYWWPAMENGQQLIDIRIEFVKSLIRAYSVGDLNWFNRLFLKLKSWIDGSK